MHRRALLVLALPMALVLALTGAGCSRAVEPVRDSQEALGTVVSVTAYPATGVTEARVRDAVAASYSEMSAVEDALDAHDPESVIAAINESGGGQLPAEALEALDAVDALGVSEQFSPYLLEVVALYDFEGGGRVPATSALYSTLTMTHFWQVSGDRVQFRSPHSRGTRAPAPSGLDFGGAAKGLALDRAVAALEGSSAAEAALVTAGSTTVTMGSKPDGEPWRVGVEDPRDPEATVATVEATGTTTISTSGDYQRYFERDGVRYHHILDPASGLPARGMRSLTVVGAASGLDSDILSTALFVMGADRATAYAKAHDLGLVLVDDEGRVRVVPGPEEAEWRIIETDR